MRKRKRLVSLFYLNDNIAGKDMFLVPKYLADELDMDCAFVFPQRPDNVHLKGTLRGVKLIPIRSASDFYSSVWREKERLWWLICNARKIDVLSLFWLNKRNMIFARVYKWLNPRGICYIKGDMSVAEEPSGKWKKRAWDFFSRPIDILSVETKDIYDKICKGNKGVHLARVVVWMPNGFDIEMFEQLGIKRKTYSEKENLILTVGRIGSVQKANETMLRALDGVDMREWRFEMVGPIEKSFESVFDDFIARNPEKKNKVILAGVQSDRRTLWEKYNSAKIFLLTSLMECMAQVYSEALAWGNYILTTRVQGAEEITDHERLGQIVEIGDSLALRERLEKLLRDDSIIQQTVPEAHKLSDERYNWRNQVRTIAERVKEIWEK